MIRAGLAMLMTLAVVDLLGAAGQPGARVEKSSNARYVQPTPTPTPTPSPVPSPSPSPSGTATPVPEPEPAPSPSTTPYIY